MDVAHTLRDILIVLVAAKAAAEVAERIKLPAVVGEILMGIALGPSVLGLLGHDETLGLLGELGVILLLFQVGLEMDVAELGAVGRASLLVAVIGVVVPMVAGYAVSASLGMTGDQALFVGAALTATSVGITARVFGDLRALASVEARTVLGAAVADDVLGLVILTVVVRIVSEGTVAFGTVAGVIVLAAGFLVVAGGVGLAVAPRAFEFLGRHARSGGTLMALALAFTLGLAQLAEVAGLAPIVGAFVAGLSVSRARVVDRIHRDLTPVGQLFIPVFFLQIGVEADVRAFGDPTVLATAGALLAVGIIGKLAAAAGMIGAAGDRLLVGLGMIPRGEVGLIFATLGLREGVFGQDIYAALLLVVLITTLMAPPLLRWRLLRLDPPEPATGLAATSLEPPQGWLAEHDGYVDLVARPVGTPVLGVALDAALRCDRVRPGPNLLDCLAALPDQPLRWDSLAVERLFRLLRDGGPRSWRFLGITSVLERALPELGEAIEARRSRADEVDPLGVVHWPRLADLQRRAEVGLPHAVHDSLQRPEWVALAAVILDAAGEADPGAPVAMARRVVERLDLGPDATAAVAALVDEHDLLLAASRRLDGLSHAVVAQVASHVDDAEHARALYLLAVSAHDDDPVVAARLDGLLTLVLDSLDATDDPTLPSPIERIRREAETIARDPAAVQLLETAPRAAVAVTGAELLAAQARLAAVPLRPDEVRVLVRRLDGVGMWSVSFVLPDGSGALAAQTQVLADAGCSITEAVAGVWGDGIALSAFTVVALGAPPGNESLADALQETLRQPLSTAPAPDLAVTFDERASPWHTLCLVQGPDRPGLLHQITGALAASGVSVHLATVQTAGGHAVDTFEVTDAAGRRLSVRTKDAVVAAIASGVAPRPDRWWRREKRCAASATR